MLYWESPGGSHVTNNQIGTYVFENRKGPQTCQLYVYFQIFEVNEPTEGVCIDCILTISGHNDNQFVSDLCANFRQQSSQLFVHFFTLEKNDSVSKNILINS